MSLQHHVEKNKELFLRYQDEVINRHDFSESNLRRFISDDFVDHSDRREDLRGNDAVKMRQKDWLEAFPDSREETTKVIGERDLLAVMFTTSGRHVAPYLGIPASNRNVAIKGIRIVRVVDGRIAELWAINDYLAIATQLGAQIAFQPAGAIAGGAPSRARPPREAISYEAQVAKIQTRDPAMRRNILTLLGFQRDIFNAQDWRVETLARYLKSDIIDHNAFAGDPPGLEGVQYRFAGWQAAFDDSEEENVAMVGEDDTLAVLYHLHASHNGNFMGIPATKRSVSIPGIEILRFEDGMIAEHWGIYDFMVTAQEVGAKLVFRSSAFGAVA